MSYGFCDQIAKLIPFNQNLDAALTNVNELKQLYIGNDNARKIIDAAKKLEGVARHASVHACGTVISDKPLIHYLPLQYAPQDNNVILTQFEMHAVESLGLLKIDLLGLKNLTIIEDTIRLAEGGGKGKIDIDRLPAADPKTMKMLRDGDTTGVFQFESAGMRRYMKDLQPTGLEDLVALVALYRPGPIELIPSFIKRKHGQEKITYLHPKLEPIMKNTYGVGVYQEQMMRIATDLAGYTLAEADTLRKAIGKKIKSLLDKQRDKLISGMIKNGINERIAKAIWELFPPFARYGFNRSHAVCYATIGYQTAYLRANYPVEFMTALLNADANDIERIAFLVSECKKMGINVLPPDINQSWQSFTPENRNIRFGLLAIKNVGRNIVEAVIEERQKNGPYKKLSELITRVNHKDLNKKSLESLIKCGVFDSVGLDRNIAISNINEILKFGSLARKHRESSQMGLFGGEFMGSLNFQEAPPVSTATKLAWEKELVGLYVSDHPLNPYKEKLTKTKPIEEALATRSENVSLDIGGIITKVQKINTRTGQPMIFARLEDFSNAVEVVVFPSTFMENSGIWEEGRVVMARGRISWRNNEPKFICSSVKNL
jgi:DNA polymerase-3 subunit alpha